MSLQFDGNGQVNLGAGVVLQSTVPFSLVFESIQYNGDGEMIAGSSVDASRPFMGWFSGSFQMRLGATTTLMGGGALVVGEHYRLEISCNGSGVVTVTIPGIGSAAGVINTTVNLDILGAFVDGVNFTGAMAQKLIVTNALNGNFEYDFESPEGGLTLFESVQGQNGTLEGFTTGGFGPSQNQGDTTPPTILLAGALSIELAQGTPYVEPGYTASDDTDGDITGSVVVGGDVVDENVLGSYTITYNVQDAAGNSATQATRTVNVVAAPDLVAPTITLFGANPLTLLVGTPYVEPGYEATDDIDGDVTADVVIGGDVVDENTPGTYAITYDVSDAAGNTAEQVTRIINVVSVIVPPGYDFAIGGECVELFSNYKGNTVEVFDNYEPNIVHIAP